MVEQTKMKQSFTDRIQVDYGEPTRFVPSWSIKYRYDLGNAQDACERMDEGEWLPVTLEDIKKANGYQTAAQRSGLFNVLRRKNIVYLQLVETNGVAKVGGPSPRQAAYPNVKPKKKSKE